MPVITEPDTQKESARKQTMKAIAVHPGKPNSIHLAEFPKPAVADVPGGRGVLVKVLRVGVDGTRSEERRVGKECRL